MLLWLPILVLASIQDPDVDALLKQLEDDSIEVRDRAAAALVQGGADEPVRKLAGSARGELKARCEAILRTLEVKRKLSTVLPPLRRVTLDAKEARLIDVLMDLQRQSGMAMRLEGMPDAAVTVAAKEAAPLEALEAVCKAANIAYSVDRPPRLIGPPSDSKPGAFMAERGPPSIRFQSGYVAAPRFFARHYAVEATGLSRKGAAGTLTLCLGWTPETRPESAWIEVGAVTDEKGRSLATPDRARNQGPSRGGSVHRTQSRHSVALAFPEIEPGAVVSVKGTARLQYVKEERSVRFDKAPERVGTSEDYDGLRIELSRLDNEDDALRLTFTVTGRRNSATDAAAYACRSIHARQFRVRLDDGSTPVMTECRSTWKETESSYDLVFRAVKFKVASIEIVLDTVNHEDSFDFELKNIPLPK
ncbi:MAG TPA: hypothetical protein VFS19_06550 [Planctomycetota bacterium]|nr:hypothetical protein [Planctomycetota bacterium]